MRSLLLIAASAAGVLAVLTLPGCTFLDEDECLDRGQAWDKEAERCVPNSDHRGWIACRGVGSTWDYDRHRCRHPRSAEREANLRVPDARAYLRAANRLCARYNAELDRRTPPPLPADDRSGERERYDALQREELAALRRIEPPARDRRLITTACQLRADGVC